jgi:hypothetical protein
LARRDFQELSNVFADGKPGQDAGLEKLSNSVDRVILYIDDLDRCEPEKVVDVLQAVHLLLAYPLFGVVVGVDQRCLKQSLRIRFKGLLTADDRNDSGRSPTAEDEIPAAPLDYLEKIFHIPFHLPPMTAPGFSTLVEKLTESVVPPKPFAGNVKPRESAAQDVRDATPPPTRVGIPIRAPATLEHANPPRAKPVLEDASVVGSVPLNAWERNALKDYHSLIRTPRGATRLLNTYRLLRAGVTLQEWDSFRGDSGGMAEFRLPMLLLGVAAGQPAVARDWFKVLRNRECVTPLSAEEVAHANLFEWENFGKLYALLSTEMKVPLTNEMVGKWLDRVERYTF